MPSKYAPKDPEDAKRKMWFGLGVVVSFVGMALAFVVGPLEGLAVTLAVSGVVLRASMVTKDLREEISKLQTRLGELSAAQEQLRSDIAAQKSRVLPVHRDLMRYR